MSKFLRKLREFLVADEPEAYADTLPYERQEATKFVYKGQVYLYESIGSGHTFLSFQEFKDPLFTLVGSTSVTFLLGKEVNSLTLTRVGQFPAPPTLPVDWIGQLRKGVEKREELIKRVGKNHD